MTRLVLAHDYLGQFGGAEKVVLELCRTFPDAPLYASYYAPDRTFAEFQEQDVRTTFLNAAPGIEKWYRAYLAAYPLAFRMANLPDCDVVLSSSSAFAKGVKIPSSAVHICYCHSPMRFAWGLDAYLNNDCRRNALISTGLRPMMRALCEWDLRTNTNVDLFIANSQNVAGRIERLYGRHADVIYPPVELGRFAPNGRGPEDFYLVVSRLAGYKRVDLAVEACTKLRRRLIVAGDGPQRAYLESIAGPTVEFLGTVGWAAVPDLMSRCRALLFCGDEDFGMVPVEAMASGRPVIAYGRGGALETVVDGETGLFFDMPFSESLMAAIVRFEALDDFPSDACAKRAATFSDDRFRRQITEVVQQASLAREPSPWAAQEAAAVLS
jgi:glycosyltransferase involved in cell wall biosynthesis